MQTYDPIHQLKLYVDMLGDDANEEQTNNLLAFILREIPSENLQQARDLVDNIGDLYCRLAMAK